MRNIDTYRPPVDLVHKEIMNPRITPHHQPATWKYRSPVLSESNISAEGRNRETVPPACQAFRQQTTEASTHGGLQSHEYCNMILPFEHLRCSLRCEQQADGGRESETIRKAVNMRSETNRHIDHKTLDVGTTGKINSQYHHPAGKDFVLTEVNEA